MIQDPEKRPVEDVLREEKLRNVCHPPVTVRKGTPLRDALARLAEDDAGGAILIVEPRGDKEVLAGIFTERDYLLKIAGNKVELDTPIEAFMTENPRTVTAEDTVDTALRLMTEGGYRHLPVVREDGTVEGIVSTQDIIVFLSEFFPMEVYNLPPSAHRNITINNREGG